MAELMTQGEYRYGTAGTWLALFNWRTGGTGSVTVNPSTNGTMQLRTQQRWGADGTASSWSAIRSVTVAIPAVLPFLTLAGIVIKAARFRPLPAEVSAGGIVARNWEIDGLALTEAAAAALIPLLSYNLIRTVGWQLRGQGYGDVAMGGTVLGGAAAIRIESSGEADYRRTGDGWVRVLSLRLREQVSP